MMKQLRLWRIFFILILCLGFNLRLTQTLLAEENVKPTMTREEMQQKYDKIAGADKHINDLGGDLRYEEAVLSDLQGKYDEARAGGYTDATKKLEGRIKNQQQRVTQVENQIADSRIDAVRWWQSLAVYNRQYLAEQEKRFSDFEATIESAKKNGNTGLAEQLDKYEREKYERNLEEAREAAAGADKRLDQLAGKETLDLFVDAAKKNLGPSENEPIGNEELDQEPKPSESDEPPATDQTAPETGWSEVDRLKREADRLMETVDGTKKDLANQENFQKELEEGYRAAQARGDESMMNDLGPRIEQLKEYNKSRRDEIEYYGKRAKEFSAKAEERQREKNEKNKQKTPSSGIKQDQNAFGNFDAMKQGGVGLLGGAGNTPLGGLDGSTSRDMSAGAGVIGESNPSPSAHDEPQYD